MFRNPKYHYKTKRGRMIEWIRFKQKKTAIYEVAAR